MKMYLNGLFVEPKSATVSVMDRGFLFGDGVYEVIPVYNRRPFYLDAHLDRLQKSFDGIRLINPHSRVEWVAIVEGLIAQNKANDQYLYLHVSRGAAPKRDHAFPTEVHQTVLGITNALPVLPQKYFEEGISAITLPDMRWDNCHLKTTALLPNTMLRQAAIEAGATEAILFRDGMMTEGAGTNIVIVIDGQIISAIRDHRILHGITLGVVESLATEHGIPMIFRDIPEAEFRRADEVWMLASTKEVLPITTVDGQLVGDGRPGPLFKQMLAYYQVRKQAISR